MELHTPPTVPLSTVEHAPAPHRGWAIMEQGSVALAVIAVIALVLGGIYGLKSKTNVGTESSNIESIITNTQSLMAGADGYNFTSGAKMMGALIEMNAVPRTMRVGGDRASGTATLYNTWGGEITLAPVTTNGFANGFTLTYEKVPQSECIELAVELSKSAVADGITINSTSHADGKVSIEDAGSQCTADSSGTGTNKLVFTVNG